MNFIQPQPAKTERCYVLTETIYYKHTPATSHSIYGVYLEKDEAIKQMQLLEDGETLTNNQSGKLYRIDVTFISRPR